MDERVAAPRTAHIAIDRAIERLRATAGTRAVPLFEHASLLIEYYAPRGVDTQQPHTRDEVYVIARGRGTFYDGTTRRRFEAGDLLFVAAGIEHRFEAFSEDFGAWVMFYGPQGGERP
ncbi:MAG TPA: cupin domain-containing protein [Casimicrobiaceae bacterium]|nr:cupin domain-containing protein [Casimicrobiaceae bacterium]